MSEQETVKKKRIRAGHRGFVKRITSQAQEMLEGEINVAKLTQYLTSLKDKLGIISTIDSEILVATEDQDDIANEIEQADITRELIDNDDGDSRSAFGFELSTRTCSSKHSSEWTN